MAVVSVEGKAQLQEIVRGMRSAERATEGLDAALKTTAKTAKTTQTQLTKIGTSAKKAGDGAAKAKKGVDALRKGSEVAQGSLGALGSRLAGVVEIVGMMGPQGIAVAAFLAGAAAMVIGAGLVAKALLDNVLAADEVIKRYRQLGREIPISAEQELAITEASIAWEEFGLILDDIGLIFSGTIAPAVRQGTKDILDVSLRVKEVAASFKNWELGTLDGIAALVSAFDPMRDFQGQAEGLIKVNKDLAASHKAIADEVGRMNEANQQASVEALIAANEALIESEEERDTKAEARAKQAADRETNRIGNIVALRAEAAEAEVEFAIQTAATIAAIREQENADFLAAIDTEIAAVTARKVEIMEAEATIAAHKKALADQEAIAQGEQDDQRRRTYELAGQLAADLGNLTAQIAGDSAIAQKLAAIFEATVRGAAQVAAVAANPVQAAITAGIVGVQVASIAATPTPSFLGGGRVEGPMSPAGGIPAMLHGNETVFNAVGSQQFSDQDVARANRGEDIRGGAVPFRFKHLLRWIEMDRGDRVRQRGVLAGIDKPQRFGQSTARGGRHNGDL